VRGLWRPWHRIIVLVVIIVAMLLLRSTGQSPADALAVLLLAGSTAAKVISWLGGQPGHGPAARDWS
jgi:hypothetical protein